MSRFPGVVVLLSLAAPAAAEPVYRTELHPVSVKPGTVPRIVNSHILFLNNCKPAGCVVKTGNPDSRVDSTDIGTGTTTLSAFAGNDTEWQAIVTCVKTTLQPFNVTVTDVDPGTADHFEVMIAGMPQQRGQPCDANGCVLGIADYLCQPSPVNCGAEYYPNDLVFAFANVMPADATLWCGTAVQEISHAWTLDHSTLANDPMTYKTYAAPLRLQDGAPCGSDCIYQCGSQVCNAFGVPCQGTGANGTHVCMETGTATQDEVQILTNLFGAANATLPTLMVTPGNGDATMAGANIDVTCTSPDGIAEVDYEFDGVLQGTLTAAPFMFTVPAGTKDGTHTITVLCESNVHASADVTNKVLVGQKCSADSDCPPANICYQQVCIPGPNAAGGLGQPCMNDGDCASGQCVSDGSTSACVVPCDPNHDQCPSNFGCVATGGSGANQTGVCFPGASHGGGCCDSGGGSPATPLLLGGIAALWITRRKRPVS
jgi:hypothetical protein